VQTKEMLKKNSLYYTIGIWDLLASIKTPPTLTASTSAESLDIKYDINIIR
jgi:hypothetical protein